MNNIILVAIIVNDPLIVSPLAIILYPIKGAENYAAHAIVTTIMHTKIYGMHSIIMTTMSWCQ